MSIETIKINEVEYVRKDSIKPQVETMKNIVMVRTYSAGVHFGELVSREVKKSCLKTLIVFFIGQMHVRCLN